MMKRHPKQPKPNQEIFINEYLRTSNATQSAITAGYAPNAARRQAARLLTKDHIRVRIRDGRDAIREQNLLSIAQTIRELKIVAMCDLGDFLDFSGQEIEPFPANQIDPQKRRALQKAKKTTKTTRRVDIDGVTTETTETVIEYSLWNKLDALDKLCKHQGLFVDVDDLKELREKIEEIEAKARLIDSDEDDTVIG